MNKEIDYEILKAKEEARNDSDKRYSFKWVEKAMWSGIGILAAGAIVALTRIIYK